LTTSSQQQFIRQRGIWWYGKCPDPGRIGANILRDGVSDEHNNTREASDRCRISGADVHYVGADRAVPQGIERTTRESSGCDT